ncbi:Hypothetical predicted protein [Pelobates cultripes]|uniref:Uncharacterized protein n=1 Tax=Pelobates cultripes TaxID=61616 RepID=A0AAD1S7N3_PELCU|nr:Hypothetical predicted protein [Pelobates cultripes]
MRRDIEKWPSRHIKINKTGAELDLRGRWTLKSVAPSPMHIDSANIHAHECKWTSRVHPNPTTLTQPLPEGMGQPSCFQEMEEMGTDSDGSEPTRAQDAPLTLRDLKTMLKEATTDIKYHLASELDRQLSDLKDDIETLATRSNQAEACINDLTTKTQAHSQDLTYLHANIESMEESLKDLNNRSRRNNYIQNRGLPETVVPEGLHSTLKGLFKTILPDASEQDLITISSPNTTKKGIGDLQEPRIADSTTDCSIPRASRGLQVIPFAPTLPQFPLSPQLD